MIGGGGLHAGGCTGDGLHTGDGPLCAFWKCTEGTVPGVQTIPRAASSVQPAPAYHVQNTTMSAMTVPKMIT